MYGATCVGMERTTHYEQLPPRYPCLSSEELAMPFDIKLDSGVIEANIGTRSFRPPKCPFRLGDDLLPVPFICISATLRVTSCLYETNRSRVIGTADSRGNYT